MTQITKTHFLRLIEIESQVQYDEFPPEGQEPLELVIHDAPVLVSAPHGAKSFRNSKDEIWHEEDEYTAGMALLLADICQIPAIALKWKSANYDPNFTDNNEIAYKLAIKNLIEKHGVKYVLDLHGAALYSPTLDRDQTIDLGIRQKDLTDLPSMDLTHVHILEQYLCNSTGNGNPQNFVVRRNKFPAKGKGTITTFASTQIIPTTDMHIQALQIEMKPQVRVAKRFSSASLYKSCGPYAAEPASVLDMLQSLVNFIEYLKTK